jgi:hypothetical protein
MNLKQEVVKKVYSFRGAVQYLFRCYRQFMCVFHQVSFCHSPSVEIPLPSQANLFVAT